jgi:hypothetical protein
MNNNKEFHMANAKVSVLTKEHIASVARGFRWNRQMPKWTVIVEGRELPARPLVLEAAGVPPNDPTNSHQAVAILQDRGFVVRYQGKVVRRESDDQVFPSATSDLIRSLRGCLKGEDSLVQAWELEHRIEKDRTTK